MYLRFAIVLDLVKDDPRVLHYSSVAVGIKQNIMIVVHCFVNMSVLADDDIVIEAPNKSLGDLGLVLCIECRGASVVLWHFVVDFDKLAAHRQNVFDDIAVEEIFQTLLIHIDTRTQCLGSVIRVQRINRLNVIGRRAEKPLPSGTGRSTVMEGAREHRPLDTVDDGKHYHVACVAERYPLDYGILPHRVYGQVGSHATRLSDCALKGDVTLTRWLE